MAKAFYQNCLQAELTRRCERNARYSLRAFARALGFEASVISQIISGSRVPSLKSAEKLIGALALSPEVKEDFISSLAETHRARGLQRLNPFFRKYAETQAPPRELNLDLFRVIAEWHHYAILSLSLTKGFKSEPTWIASELGITVNETNLALERLLALGFLEKIGNEYRCSTDGFTTADKHLTNAALKKHQKQILEKAVDSLENDPIEKRCMTSMTMAVDPERIAMAKQMIEEFTQKLTTFLESGQRSQVYELGIALFPLQKGRSDR